MKASYIITVLSLIALTLLTSCGPDSLKDKNPKTEVSALTLSQTSATIPQGGTLQLTATTTPADAKVTYSTDNASIASVSEVGLVKALAPGAAKIIAQAGDKKAICTVTVIKAGNVSLYNELDKKKYPSGSSIDYVATVSQDDASSYDLQLSFSVLKTSKYNLSYTFDEAVSGRVCIGESCTPLENKTTYTEDVSLVADEEEADEKPKGDRTSISTHIDVSKTSGGIYKNRLVIDLKPDDGSEALKWTINLAITVK